MRDHAPARAAPGHGRSLLRQQRRDRDGKLLFVSNEDASALSVVEIASAKVLHTTAVGAQPEGVTVSPEGTSVYVTSEEDSEIDVVSLPPFALVARIKVDARPRGIVFTRDGKRAFVSCEQGAAVDVIDAARKVRSGRIAISGQGVKPMGLALSADGRTLFASTGWGGSVAVIDTASLRVERVIPAVGARPWG